MLAGVGDRRKEIHAEHKGKRMTKDPLGNARRAGLRRDILVVHLQILCVDGDAEGLKGLYDIGFTYAVVAVE